MAKIKPVPPENPGWLVKAANRYSRKRLGRELEPTSMLGHSSAILGGYAAFELAQGRATRVSARLKSLAQVKAAMMVGCPF